MSDKASILVVDDELEIRESLEELLGLEGYSVTSAADGEEGLQRLEQMPFDVVLLDVALPRRDGLEILKEIRARDPDLLVIMLTAFSSLDNMRAAWKAGAHDFITKPWQNDKLIIEIENALGQRRLQSENVQLRRALKRYNLPNIVGKSERMQKVFDLITQVAASRATVLIQGESGTGKELVAKTIHGMSPRADKPFVPVNTGSMPVDLLESILFGHVKGAFTSAIASKKGLFELADQGSIFFDEIGTIGMDTQAKLLRVIQEREFMRLGGTETVRVEVRILAATNSDLRAMVQEGKFREDLFYRLNVIPLQLPPLRDRREDIPSLVDHFLEKYSKENSKTGLKFSPEALRILLDYAWPGNVRELENAVERAVVLSTSPLMGPELLPEQLQNNGSRPSSTTIAAIRGREVGSLYQRLEAYERQVIVEMLEQTNWSQTEAAERFNIPLSTLNQKIKRLNIEVRRRREG